MIPRYRPLVDHWDWQRYALCRGMDTSLFFSPAGERGRARQVREEKARAICAACAVREVCARTALNSGEQYGFWGGLTEGEREVIRLRLHRRNLPPRAA
ncbi:WhiB family transcriptional regulator [Streptomyces sp. NPDC051572]|uniref:WhiB family transcriptional regulator n=1 Tax=unclassified Streptomyces TaxID=2593676 RepID=UPI00344F3E89